MAYSGDGRARRLRKERTEIHAILARLGALPLPSTGDFVAARMPAAGFIRAGRPGG
jgi:hypothetical protein